MAVIRIDRKSLEQILNGEVEDEHEVVIKLYGTNCHLCHALKPEYENISQKHNGVYFFAFNMKDGKGLEEKFGFSGVPTVCYVKTGGKNTRVAFMKDPDKAHPQMWYRPEEIMEFIKNNREQR